MLISNPEKTPTTNQLLPMSTECPICADTYNKSTSAKVALGKVAIMSVKKLC